MSRSLGPRGDAGGGAARPRSVAGRGGRAADGALPAQLTPLVGRERELEDAIALILSGATRLLTFTGPAGIGKTRMALAVAARLASERTDDARFVDLAAVSDPASLGVTIAQALGLQEPTERPPLDRLVSYLRDRRLVIVLDNFEQIVPAAPLVGELLAACPDLAVLVTSRAPLHLYGEHEFAVPPLAVPRAGRAQLHGSTRHRRRAPLSASDVQSPPRDASALLDYAAVRLFVQRAQAVARDFALSADNADAVAELCVRLDGLPLAIELAAAHSKVLSPTAMLERLPAGAAHHAPLRAGAPRDRPARHQTLRAAIGWSYDLLAEHERVLFRRLAVFVGGFDEAAAAAVAAGSELRDASSDLLPPTPELLYALVDKSLVQVACVEAGETRFGMLETVRSFAAEQLATSGEAEETGARHAAYFSGLAQRASLTGARQVDWLAALDRERGNLGAALAWATDRRDVESVARLVNALWWFWCRRGYLAEGRSWLETALALTADACAADGAHAASDVRQWRARTLNAAGAIAWYQGDHVTAAGWLEDGLTLARSFGDRAAMAQALMFLGLVRLRRGEMQVARRELEESVVLRRALGDRWGTAMSLTALAGVPLAEGKLDEMRRLERESAALFREVGDRWSLTMPLYGQSMAAYHEGDYATARSYLEEVLAIRREVGDTWATASTLHSLGQVARAAGERERALSLFQESLTAPRALGNRNAVAQCLAAVAGIARECGSMERAARLLGAAQALFDAAPLRMHAAEQARFDADLAAVRDALGEPAFARAFEDGGALPLAQAVREAIEVRVERSGRAGGGHRGNGAALTRREREVAQLIAGGLTNRQIAAALSITEGTAGSHVEHILAKLGFQSRAQVAAWATAQGLTG